MSKEKKEMQQPQSITRRAQWRDREIRQACHVAFEKLERRKENARIVRKHKKKRERNENVSTNWNVKV